MTSFSSSSGSSSIVRGFEVAQMVKNLPAMQETWVQSRGPGMATHSSILAWRIPQTEKPGRLQLMVEKNLT